MMPFDDVTVFAESAPEPDPTPDPPDPAPIWDYNRPFLLEGYDGGPPTEGGCVVQHQERKFTHDGVHYEHVAEDGTGRWIYRAM